MARILVVALALLPSFFLCCGSVDQTAACMKNRQHTLHCIIGAQQSNKATTSRADDQLARFFCRYSCEAFVGMFDVLGEDSIIAQSVRTGFLVGFELVPDVPLQLFLLADCL